MTTPPSPHFTHSPYSLPACDTPNCSPWPTPDSSVPYPGTPQACNTAACHLSPFMPTALFSLPPPSAMQCPQTLLSNVRESLHKCCPPSEEPSCGLARFVALVRDSMQHAYEEMLTFEHAEWLALLAILHHGYSIDTADGVAMRGLIKKCALKALGFPECESDRCWTYGTEMNLRYASIPFVVRTLVGVMKLPDFDTEVQTAVHELQQRIQQSVGALAPDVAARWTAAWLLRYGKDSVPECQAELETQLLDTGRDLQKALQPVQYPTFDPPSNIRNPRSGNFHNKMNLSRRRKPDHSPPPQRALDYLLTPSPKPSCRNGAATQMA
eukprot:NODE_746_length_1222_cov_117.973516_g706_i0.p1 GENE.NODE_746_length_1222_cov_117.973516_g706_i0~~NODE_746_length_1222_cov_117.973516_g706_i0.p1  ORF type:complete len:325 (+),score=44.30 NODE_746_length_1222_cov_117.973516_g706_i0:122-1096(+)